MLYKSLAAIAGLALSIASADAAFVKQLDFDGTGAWTGSGTVVSGIAGASGNVISVVNTDARGYTALTTPIANNTTGTLFFRMRRANANVNYSIGLADTISASAAFGDYEAQLNQNGAQENQLRIRSAGTFLPVGALAADTWFNVWVVVNNSLDTSTIYVSESQASLPLASGTTTEFTFRNTTAGALTHFLLMTGGAGSDGSVAHVGPIYVDDVYIDPAGSNLVNPIPEPASLAVIGLAALSLMRRRC